MNNMSLRCAYYKKVLALGVCLFGGQIMVHCSNQQKIVLNYQRKIICEAFDKASVNLLPINLLEAIKEYIGSNKKEWYTAKCCASVTRDGEQSMVSLVFAASPARELTIPYVVKALTLSPEGNYLFLIGQQMQAQQRKLMLRTIYLLTISPQNYRYIEGKLESSPTNKFFVDSFFSDPSDGRLTCKYSSYDTEAMLAERIAKDYFTIIHSVSGPEYNWKKAKKFKFPKTEQQKQQDCIIS